MTCHKEYTKSMAMASQITGVSIVCWTVCSGTDQRKYKSSALLAFMEGIHRRPVDSSHKGPLTRKCIYLMASPWCRLYAMWWGSHIPALSFKHNTNGYRYHEVPWLIVNISWWHQICSQPNHHRPSVLAIDIRYLCSKTTNKSTWICSIWKQFENISQQHGALLLDQTYPRANLNGSLWVFVRDKYNITGPKGVQINNKSPTSTHGLAVAEQAMEAAIHWLRLSLDYIKMCWHVSTPLEDVSLILV